MKAMLLQIQLLGSGSTLRACAEMNRNCYGFEIKKDFYNKAKSEMISDEILRRITSIKQISFDEIERIKA